MRKKWTQIIFNSQTLSQRVNFGFCGSRGKIKNFLVYPLRNASFIQAECLRVPSAAPWPDRINRSAAYRCGAHTPVSRPPSAAVTPTDSAEVGLMRVGVFYQRGQARGVLPGLRRDSPERMRRDNRIVLTCNEGAPPARCHGARPCPASAPPPSPSYDYARAHINY